MTLCRENVTAHLVDIRTKPRTVFSEHKTPQP